MKEVKLIKGEAVKILTNPDLIDICLADGWELAEKPKAEKPVKKEK